MITLTLKNGVIAEFSNHKEAALFLFEMHKLNTRPVVINKSEKTCKICKEGIPNSKHNLCDKDSCNREAKRQYQKKWYRRHRGKGAIKVPVKLVDPVRES